MKIDTNTVQSLLLGAVYLQLGQIQEACEEFMIPRLQPSTALGTMKFADSLFCVTLIVHCIAFIKNNFPAVSLCDEFLDLTANEMMELLSEDELNVNSEKEVFEALVRWVQKDPLSRKKHFPKLLCNVRLTLINLDYLVDKVFKHEFIKSSPECRELIDEVKDYFLMLKIREVLPTHFKTQPRCFISLSHYIFAMENSESITQPIRKMEVYDSLVGKWSSSKPMNGVSLNMAVAVLGNILYFIGGSNSIRFNGGKLNEVQTFNTVTNQWSHTTPMQIRRSHPGAGALAGKLYVCGGHSGQGIINSVECFDSHIWRIVKSMKHKRKECAVAALNGCLYAAGGYNGFMKLKEVERYDPVTDNWTEVAPMCTTRYRLGMTALNGKLYACGGHRDMNTYLETVEMYDPIDNKWQMVTPMNNKRSGLSLIATAGKLWAIGGSNGEISLSSVEIYDPLLDKWTSGPSMNEVRGEVLVGVVPLSS